MIQKILPGIVALLCGIFFMVGRKSISQAVLNSHETFWKGLFKLQGEIGRFGEFFLNTIILFLGFVFLFTGIFLIYQYITQ